MPTYSASEIASLGGDRETALIAGDGGLQFVSKLRFSITGIGAGLAWLAFGLSCLRWPDIGDWPRTEAVAYTAFAIAGGIAIATTAQAALGKFGDGVQRRAPWLFALGAFLTLWELSTAKFGWLPLPFFPPPQSIVEVYTDDLPKLLDSALRLGEAAAWRLLHRRGRRLPHRRLHRLVTARGLLGASNPALHRTVAGDGLAADRVLHVPVRLERQHVPDRAGHRLSGDGADLVGRSQRQHRLLRRRTNARRQAVFPGDQGRDPGGAAACVRRSVHGARRVLRGAGRGRDDRRQGRASASICNGRRAGRPTTTCMRR